ncbi:MAG: methyltransferase domain-containing protein [Candidatus Omnitrophota bacterium]|jgi:SAM-dependent methyltransferase
MNAQEIFRRKRLAYIRQGRFPWLHPQRIEKQSILDALYACRAYTQGILLDIGCGEKPYQVVFDGNTLRYIGVDVLSSCGNPDIYGSGEALPFRNNSFDTVLSVQMIEHIREPKALFQEAYRVLKKGGCLIVTAPMSWGIHEAPHDYYRFTGYGLRYLASCAGFTVVSIKARGGFWKMMGQRFSNYFYCAGNKPRSFASEALRLFICALVQSSFVLLERLNKNEEDTLGYSMVARK